jgi:hypothetical protein
MDLRSCTTVNFPSQHPSKTITTTAYRMRSKVSAPFDFTLSLPTQIRLVRNTGKKYPCKMWNAEAAKKWHAPENPLFEDHATQPEPLCGLIGNLNWILLVTVLLSRGSLLLWQLQLRVRWTVCTVRRYGQVYNQRKETFPAPYN